MAHTSRHYVHFIGAGVLTVTVTAPLNGATVTNAEMVVTWSYSGGAAQRAYKVTVFTDVGLTTSIYTSGWVVSSAATATIPAGSVPNASTLYLRVDVQDTNGAEGSSSAVMFTTNFATSSNVLNVRAQAIGCEDPQSLPLVRLTWTQIVPAGGETFVRYVVQRKAAGEAAWTAVALITSVGTTAYVDYQAQPGVTYYYSVLWIASSGANMLISNAQANITAHLTFDFSWLHDVSDPTKAVRLDALSMSEELVQSVVLQETWGRSAPSALIGEADFSRFSISLSPHLLNIPTQWTMIRALLVRQRDYGSIFCLRLGASNQRFFCTLSTVSRDYQLRSSEASIDLTEVYYEEAV